MDIKEFESKLSAKELQEFKENLSLVRMIEIEYENYLSMVDNLYQAISHGFIWKRTPKGQGQEYWEQISQR